MKKGRVEFNTINIKDISDESTKISKYEIGDIAIIGISLKMPMAESVGKFWSNIKNGVDCIGEFPVERRRDINEYLSYTNHGEKCDKYLKGAYLREIDKFDYSFFRLSPKEASLMNPAQRLFLETAYEALADAGYEGSKLSGSNTGVYLGFISDLEGYKYKQMISELEEASVKELSVAGNLSAIIPSRISYLLDLKGPSMLIDTACSSSLAAVHLACQAIRNGDCDQAIAGGIRITLMPISEQLDIDIGSSDGLTRTFDDSSDGTGNGEGIVAVLLKPLSKAIKDRDNIYAVIKGSAMNQDGSSAGITAPNSVAQSEVIIKAWKAAGINPETISYIEAHGTGTKLGDPIEVDGLTKAFEKYTSKKQFCAIGSLKTNIGHLYDTAGIAGMVKAVLSLKYKQIPPSINFNRPNKKIEFDESPVYVNDRLCRWEDGETPRRCGVSSFGFSGTNCHVVLEEAPENIYESDSLDNRPNILTLSSKNPKSLDELINKFVQFMDNKLEADIRDIAYTSNIGRCHYNHRICIIFEDEKDIREKLHKLECFGYKKDIDNDIFYGEIKSDSRDIYAADSLCMKENDKLVERKIKHFVENGKKKEVLKEICELYIKGAVVKWEDLYRGEQRSRTSIPLYAFEKKRCWLKVPKNKKRIEGMTILGQLGRDNMPPEIAEEIKITIEKWKRQLEVMQIEENTEDIKVELLGRDKGEYSETEMQLATIWSDILGFMKININDNFFEMGGDSISMVKIINRIREDLKLDLGYNDFMEGSTIAGISAKMADQKKKYNNMVYSTIIEDRDNMYLPFPTTEVQMAYLMGRNEELEMGGVSTHIYIELETVLDIGRLNCAFQKVINRHPMLRTVFLPDGQQQILKEIPNYTIKLKDISELCDDDQNLCILKERDRMSHYVFKSEEWPLFELSAFKLSEDKNYLFISIDMLIADGTSLQIMSREIMAFYNDPELKLDDIELSFRDYMLAYNEFKNSDVYARDREYWLSKLETFPSAPTLPLRCDPANVVKPHFKRLNKIFNESDWNKIKKISQTNNISTSAMLCTAYADVMSYWSNQPALAINLTVFNRYPFHRDINKVIGDFTSIMLLGLDLEPYEAFMKRARHVQSTMLEALEHRHYDGVEFVREISKFNNMGTKPIMPIVFTSMLYNGTGASDPWSDIGNMKMGISQTPQVYIDHQAVEIGGELNVTWDYVEELFEQDVIELMFDQYINILLNLADGDTESCIDLGERHWQAIKNYNDKKEDIKADTIHGLFALQAHKAPDNIAVMFKNDKISYRELHEKSNRIALYLREHGVEKNDFIGVLTYRCIDTIVNLMGVLKAGAAYIPVDPMYPEERRNYIISNSGCKMMLEPGFYQENNISAYTAEDIENINSVEDVAYVIYTSGSTGKPKGVIITHGAVTNTIIDVNRKFKVSDEDVIIGISSMCFDLSVYDIFGALSAGAAIVMVADQRDTMDLINTVNRYNVTIWNSVPAIMDIAIESLESGFENNSLRLVLLSGDWIPLKLPKKIMKNFKNAEVISLGGATEGSIWSIYYPVKEIRDDWKSIPYGIPLANQEFYILNYRKEPCPVGVQGELHIGGAGVAKGYLNDKEKTENAFINHPTFGYIYKTGDYGILTPEGYIVFTGRKDHQIKIKGYRVELGEIETSLMQFKDISNAVVVDYTNLSGKKYLCAYYVSKKEIPILEIREHLIKNLPEYMVPSYFIPIDSIPLTPNGKIDRKKLPKLDADIAVGTLYAGARNEVESILVKIWSDVLGVEKVGINHNFYEMGGDSIKAIQIAARLQKNNYKVNMHDLLQYHTISELSSFVTIISSEVSQETVEGEVLLTPVQRWFFEKNFTNKNHWNQSVMLFNKDGFDEESIIKVFNKIIEHHDALRMNFHINDGQVIQKNQGLEGKFFEMVVYELEGTNSIVRMEEETFKLQSSLDLKNGPLLKIALFKTNEGDKLFITIHHLVIDGISWRILFEDFATAYMQTAGNQEIQLQRKTNSYKEWANALKKYANSQELLEEVEFWNNIENTSLEALPKDFNIDLSLRKDYSEVTVKLNKDETQALLKEVNQAYNTEINDILLTALGITIKEWIGSEKVLISLESHGRHSITENIDISRSIGWFTSMYPLILDMSSSDNISYCIKETKENLRHIPNKGIGYGVLKYLTDPDKKSNIEFKLKPEISFNYLGQFDQDINTEAFVIINELTGLTASPESENPYTFMIIGMIAEGELRITFNYNRRQYLEDSVIRIAESYRRNLKNVIGHCLGKTDKEFTPTDFGDDNLSVNDLENILDFIDGI